MTQEYIYLKLENEHIELIKERNRLKQFADAFEKACNNYIDGKTDGELNEILDALHDYHEYKIEIELS